MTNRWNLTRENKSKSEEIDTSTESTHGLFGIIGKRNETKKRSHIMIIADDLIVAHESHVVRTTPLMQAHFTDRDTVGASVDAHKEKK
jgi:hypothetical protein